MDMLNVLQDILAASNVLLESVYDSIPGHDTIELIYIARPTSRLSLAR